MISSAEDSISSSSSEKTKKKKAYNKAKKEITANNKANPYAKESNSQMNSLQSFKHLKGDQYSDDESEYCQSNTTSLKVLEECSITDFDLKKPKKNKKSRPSYYSARSLMVVKNPVASNAVITRKATSKETSGGSIGGK